jgi:hypothetical protein
VRVLAHIKRLDDCFGDFLVRVVCECGACREIQPQALARLVGWKMTLKELALRMRCSKCGKRAAEVVAVARAEASRRTEEILSSEYQLAWRLYSRGVSGSLPDTTSR